MFQAPVGKVMASRLDGIEDWVKAARAAGYGVETLARRAGVTERQLERFFGQHFACTPKKWVDELRMADARRLLRRGMMIKEVAERLGFKHVQDFTQTFVRVTGMKPSASRHRKSSPEAREAAMPRIPTGNLVSVFFPMIAMAL
jgi:transcriptional regulator GlxA family with amidase domain